MNILQIRQRVKVLLDEKKIKKTDIARNTGLGYMTVVKILNDDYPFEVKASTIKKIEAYLRRVK